MITAWAVMALKSAKVAGLHVDHAAFDGAIMYLEQITGPNGAVRALDKPNGGDVDLLYTAAIALSHQFMGWGKEAPVLTGPAEMLLPIAEGAKVADAELLCLRYFGTLVMFQQGGDGWKKWNDWVKTQLLKSQRKDGDEAGSWDPREAFSERKIQTVGDLEKARAELGKALDAVRASPRATAAYEALALALSVVDSADTLQAALLKNADGSKGARSLLRMRLGLVLMDLQKFDGAAEQFRTVYAENDRPENVLVYCVHALIKAGRGTAALELLAAEANEGRLSAWRRNTIAMLLFEAAPAIPAPVAYVAEHIKEGAAKDSELFVALALQARMKNVRDAEAAFYAQAYALGEHGGRAVASYAEALRASGKAAEGLALLMHEAAAGRTWPGHAAMIAEFLLDEKSGEADVVGRIDSMQAGSLHHNDQAGVSALRLAVFQQAAILAERSGKRTLSAVLFERAYVESGRPAELVQSVVMSFVADGRHMDAARELERVIQAGYHTPWAFKTLAEMDLALHRGTTEILRAVSSETELFPRDAQPHLNLAQFFESNNQPFAALAQYREATRVKPDDPYYLQAACGTRHRPGEVRFCARNAA